MHNKMGLKIITDKIGYKTNVNKVKSVRTFT